MKLISNEILWAGQWLTSCAAPCLTRRTLACKCIYECWGSGLLCLFPFFFFKFQSCICYKCCRWANSESASLIPSMMMVVMVVLAVTMVICVLIVKNVNPQPNKGRGESKELRMLCAEDEQARTCWMTAFRLFKVTPWLKNIQHSFWCVFFLFRSDHSIIVQLPNFGQKVHHFWSGIRKGLGMFLTPSGRPPANL